MHNYEVPSSWTHWGLLFALPNNKERCSNEMQVHPFQHSSFTWMTHKRLIRPGGCSFAKHIKTHANKVGCATWLTPCWRVGGGGCAGWGKSVCMSAAVFYYCYLRSFLSRPIQTHLWNGCDACCCLPTHLCSVLACLLACLPVACNR